MTPTDQLRDRRPDQLIADVSSELLLAQHDTCRLLDCPDGRRAMYLEGAIEHLDVAIAWLAAARAKLRVEGRR